MRMRNEKVFVLSMDGKGFSKIIFGDLNLLLSILIIIVSAFFLFNSDIIKGIIGEKFPLDTRLIIVLSIPIFLFGLLEQFAVVKKDRPEAVVSIYLIQFFVSVFMLIFISFLIFKYGINWFGKSLFGETVLGKNPIFFIPSLLYIIYSILLIFYSLAEARKWQRFVIE